MHPVATVSVQQQSYLAKSNKDEGHNQSRSLKNLQKFRFSFNADELKLLSWPVPKAKQCKHFILTTGIINELTDSQRKALPQNGCIFWQKCRFGGRHLPS